MVKRWSFHERDFLRSVVLSYFFCKQKTAYELRISDWSSDVCSSDLLIAIAATLGDFVGYWFGRKTGPVIFKRDDSFFFKKKYEIGRASCRERVCQYV